MEAIIVTTEQRDTILAALRFYQAALARNDDLLPPGVADIATNCDAHEPLGADDIDGLCEEINVNTPCGTNASIAVSMRAITSAQDSVEFTANCARLICEPETAFPALLSIRSAAVRIEREETSCESAEHAPDCAQRVHSANECTCHVASNGEEG